MTAVVFLAFAAHVVAWIALPATRVTARTEAAPAGASLGANSAAA